MTSFTRTKICGLTTHGDALAAAQWGADAIGLVFYQPSPRYVSTQAARDIAAAVGPFVTVVGLFVDAEPAYVEEVLAAVPLQLLQFHGNESPAYCESFGRPYIKALKVRPASEEQPESKLIETTRQEVLDAATHYGSAQGILLDTLSPKAEGGTGEAFNWQCVPQKSDINWILAGGLDTNNVERAVQAVHPYAVDVSSGVERSKGVKDPELIRRFIEGVKTATQIHSGK